MLVTWRDWHEMLSTGYWTVFLIYALEMIVLQGPRMFFAGCFYSLKAMGAVQNYSTRKFSATVVVTIINEPEEMLRRALSSVRESINAGTSQRSFIAIVDGASAKTLANCQRLAAIAREYCDVVLITNHCEKRKNLLTLVREARKRELLYEILIFLDSDTIVRKSNAVELLLRPFSDPRIGGTTTRQLIVETNAISQKVSFWLEDARSVSSMAAASLFGQVPCMPGRMYAVRTSIIEDLMDGIVNDYLDLGRIWKWRLIWRFIAGDDRWITMQVLRAGYKTIMVPEAVVLTTAPDEIRKTFKMWQRWGRSSQWYTILNWRMLLSPRFFMASFILVGDILITVSTVLIVAVNWPLSIIFGSLHESFLIGLAYAALGMMLTVFSRQFPHLLRYLKWYLWPEIRDKNPLVIAWEVLKNLIKLFILIWAFIGMMTAGQFVRFYALITPHLIGVWGTREDADQEGGDDVWQDGVDPIPPGVLA